MNLIIRDRVYFDYDSNIQNPLLTWGPKFNGHGDEVFMAEQALAEILLATEFFD